MDFFPGMYDTQPVEGVTIDTAADGSSTVTASSMPADLVLELAQASKTANVTIDTVSGGGYRVKVSGSERLAQAIVAEVAKPKEAKLPPLENMIAIGAFLVLLCGFGSWAISSASQPQPQYRPSQSYIR